jgi:hypothetical protein
VPQRRRIGRQASLSIASRAMAFPEQHSSSDASEPGLSSQPVGSSGTALPADVSLYEASSAYRGEWVLMHVTGTDGQTHAPRGTVLLHSRSRAKIGRAIQRAHRPDPTVHLYAFLGGIQRLSGDELRAALEQGAASNPYFNVRW